MPVPPTWPVIHGDGRVEQVMLGVSSPSTSSLAVTAPTLAVLSSPVDGFFAVGSAGIDPRPPGSGGVGRPLYAGTYRDMIFSPGYVVRAIAASSPSFLFVEMQG